MSLSHVLFSDLFGASASLTAGGGSNANTVAQLKHGDLGTASNVDDAITTSSGFLLALLQKAYDTQGDASDKAIDVSLSTPIITSRGGGNVVGERYIVTVYSSTPVVYPLDPNGA
jgi:hypothetical protein